MPLTLILGGEYIYYDKNLGMMVAGDNSNSELIEQSDNVPLDRHKWGTWNIETKMHGRIKI
ncbi:hypothetical protein HRF79_14915 [Enterococcus faecalis]|nr:hypothetical protein [Enterococcus faecalis]